MAKTILLVWFVIFWQFVFSQNYQIKWQNCYGGSESDKARDIIEINNDLYILGGTGSNDGDISYNHGEGDVWLVKTDSTGNIIWEKTYGGSDGETGHRIFFNNENNFYILARTGSDDGDISYNPFPNSTCFWILKIDIDGNIIWGKVVGGNGADEMWTGTITSDGGVVALGYSGSEYGDVSINYGLYDIWMIKLNSDGEIEWDFTLGTDWQDYGQAIIQTSDEGFLVGGSSKLTGGGNLDCECHGQADGVLVKLDADRNIEWQKCYGGSDYDGITALKEISDGYVFGAYVNSNDGDISGWHGENDIWIVKTDFDGNIVWQNPLGGSRSEFISSLLITGNDDIIIPGYTQSNNGDVSGNHSLTEFDYDIWFVKLSSTGELLSQQCFGGAGSEIVEFGVVKKSDYNFVIAGQSDYGPSYDVGCEPHGGNGNLDEDYWVFEIESQDTTGVIENPKNHEGVKVYHNPANTYVVFEHPGFSQGTIWIQNLFGQVVNELSVNDQITLWNTQQLPTGVYYYTIHVNGYFLSGKIAIVH